MKRVIVTGATGFIGRQCLPLLSEKGFEIHAFSTKAPPEVPTAGVRWHQIDLFDHIQLGHRMADIRPTHLLHLAWFVRPGSWHHSPENFRWVQASLDLLLAFIQNDGKRVLATGSCAEYDWKHGYCTEGLTPLAPQTTYGICKNALQSMFHQLVSTNDLSGAWGRIFFAFGPHEHSARLVPSVIRSLLEDKPAECTAGHQIRDYLYVKDIAGAIVALLDSAATGPVNIASGIPVALKEIVYTIAEHLGRRDLVRLGALETPADDPELLIANTNRLSTEIGWKPQYSLEQGLDETIDWWRSSLKR